MLPEVTVDGVGESLVKLPAPPAISVKDTAAPGLSGISRDDLPLRWNVLLTQLANAAGLTVESAALLGLTHYATWCGERSGCYTTDQAWISSACNQIVVFSDPGSQRRAQEILTEEFDRLEIGLRQHITETWRGTFLSDPFVGKIVHPSRVLTKSLKDESAGWVTWIKNPTPASFAIGIGNAYRQALTVFVDDPVLLRDMLQPRHWLADCLHAGISGSHVFSTRGAGLKRTAAKSEVNPVKISLLIHTDAVLGQQLLFDASEPMRRIVEQCLVWSPEAAGPGRLVEPCRADRHSEVAAIQHHTTRARLNNCGTRYITKDAVPVMFAWQQEARDYRATLSATESSPLAWMDVLPYRLAVPFSMASLNWLDSVEGYFNLGVRLTRYAVQRALLLRRASAKPYSLLMRLAQINPRRWTALSMAERGVLAEWVSGRERGAAAEGMFPWAHSDQKYRMVNTAPAHEFF